MSVIMITHDLGVVAEIADEIAVMYAGRIVEHASTGQLFAAPEHPYTWGLLKSIPRLDAQRGDELGPDLRPAAELDQPALRMPFPSPLPVCERRAPADRIRGSSPPGRPRPRGGVSAVHGGQDADLGGSEGRP